MTKFYHYLLKRQIGISTGNSASKSLLSQGSTAPLGSNDKFVRETLQNSCDAHDSSFAQVRMEYRYVNLDADRTKAVHKIIGLDTEILPRIASVVPGLDENFEIQSILFVDDYGTTGLQESSDSGDILDSKFGKFFFGVGDNDESSDSGGSFGYGKAVYTDKSRIRTIIAYSCYKDDRGETKKILFGVTRTKSFTYNEIKYPGFIFLCSESVDDPIKMSPFRDEVADKLAEALGFHLRTPEQTGTSVAILSPRESADVDLAEIKVSAENFWWKKIIDGELTVSVSLDDMDEQYASPSESSHLKPFIDCFQIASGRRDPEDPIEKKKTLNKSSTTGLSPGSFAYKQIKLDEDTQWDNSNLFINSVALIRASGMVTEYWKPASSGSFMSPVAGVFIANKELNKLLRSSEPASHWGWDAKSERIEEQGEYMRLPKPISLDEARSEIEGIIRRINSHFKDFAETCAPSQKINSSDFRKISKLLTDILGKGKKSVKPEMPVSRPCSIQSIQLEQPTDLEIPRITETINICLTPDINTEEKWLKVQHWLDVLGDDNGRHKVQQYQSELVETTAESMEVNGETFFKITKDKTRFKFLTMPAPRRYNRQTRTEVIEE